MKKKPSTRKPEFSSAQPEDAVAKYLKSGREQLQVWLKRELVAMNERKERRQQEKIAAMSASQPPNDSWAKRGFGFYALGREVDFESEIDSITMAFVASRVEAPPVDATLSDVRAEAVAAHLHKELQRLEYLLKARDPRAVTAYADLARHMTAKLADLVSSDKELLRRCAERCPNWPVLMGRSGLLSDNHKAIIKTLGVGSGLQVNEEMLARLRGRESKRAAYIAAGLVFRLDDWRTRDPVCIYWLKQQTPLTRAEGAARTLEPFCRSSWKDWFLKGWEILLEENGDHPERNSQLRRLGEHRKRHSINQGQQEESTLLTEESNIRDGIKKRLQEGFQSLVKLLAPDLTVRPEIPRK